MSNKKNILTVAPFLADDFVEASEIVFDVDQYQQFINDNKKRLGLFSKYLICKLHDSWVIETNITDKLFSVILNDFSTYVFADTIIEKNNLSIDSDNISFPIQLDFKTSSKVIFNEVDDDGTLTEIEPLKLDEYLYEQIISIDNDKIELAFTFWKTFQDDKPGQRFVLLLTATDIIISGRQDEAWQNIFGSDYDNYYQYFKQQFDSDRYVSDHNKCLELIDEYDATKNSTNT
jgi:hypothetical protein